MDLQSVLLDEIALEGLDGITLPTLFFRLKQVKDFSYDLDDESVQEVVWKTVLFIVKKSPFHLQLFKLTKPRPPFVLYDKFKFEESFIFYEDTDNVPDDIYSPLAPVEGEPARGSCREYKSRVNVTSKVVKDSPPLEEVLETYRESLVIVASQELRNVSLGINDIDPGMSMSDKIYCYLEKVGRMRSLGLSSVGKEANLEIIEKEKSDRAVKKTVKPKDAFYFRRTVQRKKLVKISPFLVNIKSVSLKGHVLYLSRFYNRTLTPLENVAIQTSNYLEQQSDQESDYQVLNSRFPDHNRKAFSHIIATYPKYFSAFYREFPHSNPTKAKNIGQVVKRKFVKLLKPFTLEEDEEEIEENDEDEDESQEGPSTSSNSFSDSLFYKPDVILADRPILSQVLALIEASENGLSLVEIGKQLSLNRLDTRSFVRVLVMQQCIKSIKVDVGKNKVSRYLPLNKFEKSSQEFSTVADHGLDFKHGIDTLTSAKRANCILEQIDQDLIVTGIVPLKKRIVEMEKDRKVEIDRTSVKKMVQLLESKGKLRTQTVVVETASGQRCEQIFIISNQVGPNALLIEDRITQWKFQISGNQINLPQSSSKPTKRGMLLTRDGNYSTIGSNCLTYQPSIGRKYGAEPKLVKALTMYRFLHHLLYVLPNDKGKQNEYNDWRKHIKPLPEVANGPTCLLGDIAPRIPLSIFVRIVYLTYVVPGIEEYLNDAEKCFLPVSDLPIEIQKGLTYTRKYLYSLYESFMILQHMNLAEVEYKMTESKEKAKVTLLNEMKFKDKGVLSTYVMNTDEDVELFSDDLRAHCTTTCEDCSLPPQLFAHNQRNWIDSSKSRVTPSLDLYNKRMLSMTNEIFLVRKDDISRSRKRVSTESPRRSRKKKVTTEEIINHDVVLDEEEVTPKKRRVKDEAKSPLKRVAIQDDIDIKALALLKSRRSNWTQEEDSFLILARTASLLVDPASNRSLCVHGRIVRDELHKRIDHSRDKTWKACQRRLLFITCKDQTMRTRINEWIIELKQNDDFYGIQRPCVPSTHEEVWNEAYLKVLKKLVEKFDHPFTSTFKTTIDTNIELISSIDDFVVREATLDVAQVCPPFIEPQNFVDVHMNVVLNILMSTLIMNDNDPNASQKFSKLLFNIYRRYPDVLIRACVTRLSKNNIMSKFREKNKNINKKTVSNMAVYKLSNHFNFILETKYHIHTLIDPSIFDAEKVTNEGPAEALAITSASTSRGVKFDVDIPDEVLLLDEETRKKFEEQLNPETRKEVKDSSRALLATFRSQIHQKPETSDRVTVDSFILNKCKVIAQLTNKPTLPAEFESQWNYFVREIQVDKTRCPKNDVVTFIESKQVIGASLEQIQSFKPGMKEKELKVLEKKNVIYRLGVNTFKWVHKDHIVPWIATDFNPGKKESNAGVKYFSKIWRRPDGSINTKIIYKFMASILAHVLIHPGISDEHLVGYFQQIVPGSQIREFIELLLAADCLRITKESVEVSSLSELVGTHTSEKWFETTENSIAILAQLRTRLDK